MQSIGHIFQTGGVVMYFLLLCSLFAINIGIQRINFFRKCSLTRKEEEELTSLLREKKWEEAYDKASMNSKLMSQILTRSLNVSSKMNSKQEKHQNQRLRETTYQGEATTLIHRMQEGLRYLDTIVTLSPLLGLLGTVLGMIQSFQVMAFKEGQLNIITGGVAEALVATAFGLIVAVIALCIHTYLSFLLDRSVTTLEEWGTLLQDSHEYQL